MSRVHTNIPDYDQKAVVIAPDDGLDLSASVEYCLGTPQGEGQSGEGQLVRIEPAVISLFVQNLRPIPINTNLGNRAEKQRTGSAA